MTRTSLNASSAALMLSSILPGKSSLIAAKMDSSGGIPNTPAKAPIMGVFAIGCVLVPNLCLRAIRLASTDAN